MSDGLSEESVAIDGVRFVRLRHPKDGEGYSIWIGDHCAEIGCSSLEQALESAAKLDKCLIKLFIESLVPGLMKKITQDAIDILKS